eukprot:scaffold330780_cov47-Prasinocladus_malaysianus.AAC.3
MINELVSELDELKSLVFQKEEAIKSWQKEAKAAQELAKKTAEVSLQLEMHCVSAIKPAAEFVVRT